MRRVIVVTVDAPTDASAELAENRIWDALKHLQPAVEYHVGTSLMDPYYMGVDVPAPGCYHQFGICNCAALTERVTVKDRG